MRSSCALLVLLPMVAQAVEPELNFEPEPAVRIIISHDVDRQPYRWCLWTPKEEAGA
jgi:hypothetical protein